MNRITEVFRSDRDLSVLGVLTVVTIGILLVVIGPAFLSERNLQSMGTQMAEFGLLALAMALAMLLGGIDLSVVSAAVLAGIVGTKFLAGDVIPLTDANQNLVMTLGVAAMLITGMLCGLLNGLLIAKASIPPILATLSTFVFFAGVGMVLTDGNSVPVKIPAFAQLGVLTVGNIPIIFVIMVVAYLVVSQVLKRTRSGRRMYLYGDNDVALRFTGARNERIVILTYILIGLIVGLAAMIMVSRVNSVRVGFGETYLLQAILVVVLAGFNPFGGRGKVGNLVIAIVLLQSLSSAFTIMRFDPFMKTFIWGAALLVIMGVHRARELRADRKSAAGTPLAPQPADASEDLVESGAAQ